MRQIGIGSSPQQAPAPALQLSVLSLSLSCTQEIILPLCSPAPQIYYSSPSPSSQQDGSEVTQEKEKRGKRGRCLPRHFKCCRRRLCVCLYNTASHCSGAQNEEPPLTEGVSSVQDDRGCIHSATFRRVALSFPNHRRLQKSSTKL